MINTDAEYYNKRDLLLLLQLLYDSNLIEPETVNTTNSKLPQICLQWYEHKSTKLSISQGADIQPLTVDQVVTLYKNLLQKYECKNTTELADIIYSERIKELETTLHSSQEEFTKLINT